MERLHFYLIWAPETQPNVCTEIKTAKPKLRTICNESTLLFSFHLMQLEQPKNTSNAVPNNSLKNIATISDWKTLFLDDFAIVFFLLSLLTFGATLCSLSTVWECDSEFSLSDENLFTFYIEDMENTSANDATHSSCLLLLIRFGFLRRKIASVIIGAVAACDKVPIFFFGDWLQHICVFFFLLLIISKQICVTLCFFINCLHCMNYYRHTNTKRSIFVWVAFFHY